VKIYGDIRSGNCYKLALLCRQLNIPFEWVPVDVLSGETRKAGFLEKNPNGRIPVVQLDDGRYLSESDAIMCYLAEGSKMLPVDPFTRARVLQWLFFEQYSHEPYIAVSIFIVKYLRNPADRQLDLAAKRKPGYAALGVMDEQLAKTDFLVGDVYTIADVALYAYTHRADQGGFDLEDFPNVRRWLDTVGKQPGHVSMENALG
jgi:glutathione S-transferase